VMELFPSPFIHVGGDEYFGQPWEQCPDCQRLMEKEQLRRGDNPRLKQLFAKCLGSKEKYLLYRWWMTQMCDVVRAQGRRPVLWDDLSWEGKYPEGAVVMQWHYEGGWDAWQRINTPNNPAMEAALAGHDAIVAPYSHLYFDLNSTLADVYRLEPLPAGLPADHQARILGPHAPVWGQPEDRVDNRVFPRIYALAEIGWTPKELRGWDGFAARMAIHVQQRTTSADR
jgi:hexosaminidase